MFQVTNAVANVYKINAWLKVKHLKLDQLGLVMTTVQHSNVHCWENSWLYPVNMQLVQKSLTVQKNYDTLKIAVKDAERHQRIKVSGYEMKMINLKSSFHFYSSMNFFFYFWTELCLPVSLSESQTVGLVELVQPPHGKCVNTQAIRGFAECHGQCGDSGTKFNRLTLKQDKKCQCCSVSSYEELKVPVKCTDGYKQTISVSVPKSCTCQSCDEQGGNIHIFDFLKSTTIYWMNLIRIAK